MGARLVKFEFVPGVNEQIEAIVRVPEEKRSVIHGVVKDWRNKIVKDAVVKLFEVCSTANSYTLKPINHTFTDEYGQFLFGPLCPNKKYLIKVWFNEAKIRELPITPDYPNDCDIDCDDEDEHDRGHHENRRNVQRNAYRERNVERENNRNQDNDCDSEDEEE